MEHINIINKDEREVYIYGTELMLSSIVGIFALIFASICAGKYFQWLPFLIGFVPLRLLGGGYHAKTHRGCIIAFTSVYLVCTILTESVKSEKPLFVMFSILVLFTIFLFSPVEAKNKTLSISIRTTNRRKSIVLGLINAIITTLYVSNIIRDSIWITTYLTGFISAGIFMLIAALSRKEDKK